MIGIKSIAITLVTALAVVLTSRSDAVDAEHLRHLSTSGTFAIGLFASLCAALLAFGARPGLPSKVALTFRRGRPALAFDLDQQRPRPRVLELPAIVQRLCFVAFFACIGVVTLGGDVVHHLAAVPHELTKPSRAEYCLPEEPKPEEQAAAPLPPPPPPVDQAGCALVKRAFALGYTKSLGSCAPKAAVVVAPKTPTEAKPVEICERRQLDEPFTHYAYRKTAETLSGASPVDAAGHVVDELQTRFSFTRDLLADITHSITGTPHASHHLFINLPDPHPTSFLSHAFTGEVPCTTRFSDLALWPIYTPTTPPAVVLEHAFGQLLFATRFGSPASCSDYEIHWDAPRDTCTQIAANPHAALEAHDALEPIRHVLDRRRRQLAIRALAAALGETSALPEPPPARAVTSVACLMIDPASSLAATGRAITVDEQSISMREVVMTTLTPTGTVPLDAYIALSLLLGGTKHGGPAIDDASRMFDIDEEVPVDEAGSASDADSASDAGPAADATPLRARSAELPGALDDSTFMLVALEPLVDTDPFARTGPGAPALDAALSRADVVEVYPFARHLHDFIDGFRRVYLPQRGRL